MQNFIDKHLWLHLFGVVEDKVLLMSVFSYFRWLMGCQTASVLKSRYIKHYKGFLRM